jgi:hypothetical protein
MLRAIMSGLEPQIKSIRVPASAWAIAYHIVKSGKDTFSQSELKDAACGSLDKALADGLIERLDNGLYRANIELARLYASLLPRVPLRGRRRKELKALKECTSEERREAAEIGQAWLELANWATAHAEDAEDPPKKVLEVLERHGIQVQRVVLPSGTKAVIAKVLNYYIVMDWLMVKNSPKCVRFPQLGPDAWLCASTREKLYWHLVPLTLRPQN